MHQLDSLSCSRTSHKILKLKIEALIRLYLSCIQDQKEIKKIKKHTSLYNQHKHRSAPNLKLKFFLIFTIWTFKLRNKFRWRRFRNPFHEYKPYCVITWSGETAVPFRETYNNAIWMQHTSIHILKIKSKCLSVCPGLISETDEPISIGLSLWDRGVSIFRIIL